MNNQNSYPARQPQIRQSLVMKYAIAILLAVCLSPAVMAQSNIGQPNITRVEYYIDSDPGYDNAKPLSIVPGKDLDGISFNVSLAPLSTGVHILGVRSKDENGAWSLDNKWLFVKPYASVKAVPKPRIARIEYYIDTDPGYGNATALSYASADFISNLSFSINLAPLAQGVHVVGIRSLDSNGAWSLDNRWLFIKQYTNNGAIALPKVDRVEYYIDNDPGYGNGTAISIVPNTDLSTLSLNIPLSTVAGGVHVVGIRSRDENGAWSLDNHWVFVKPYASVKAVAKPRIARIEYYIDTDPGYGKATALSYVSADLISNLSFNISLASLTQGVHVLGVRSLDSNGAWGLDNHWVFVKPYSIGAQAVQPNITQVEYWVDFDPGYGAAHPVTIAPGKDLSDASFPVDISNLGIGLEHKIGVRSRDANGAWSLDNLWDITIVSHNGFSKNATDIKSLKQEALVNNLRLQFNPVHQQAILLYSTVKDDKTTIRVFDNAGRLVLTKQASIFTGINVITLETGSLAQGIYTIQSTSSKEKLSVRMLKQ